MIPSAANVYARARKHLGDDEVSGGDIYTDAYLKDYLQEAINTMFRALENAESPLINKTSYHALPARQQYVAFSALDILSRAVVRAVRAKSYETTGVVEGLAWNATTLRWRVTSTAHGRTTNDLIYLYGVDGGADPFMINRKWPVVVIDADNFDLLGAPNSAVGSYTADAATWVYAPSPSWSLPMRPAYGFEDQDDPALSDREVYQDLGNALELQSSDQARLLRVDYRILPNEIIDTAPDLRVDGSLDFLGRMTAGLAALSKGADQTAALNIGLATGSSSLAAVSHRNPGGLLGALTQNHAQANRAPVTTQRFRPSRRTRGW